MKLNKIISSALAVVMIFGALIAAFPTAISAAYSDSAASSLVGVPEGITEANLTGTELKNYLEKTVLKYDYEDEALLLASELEKGYLYQFNSPGNLYSAFINKYT